jgi:hypothetical protein
MTTPHYSKHNLKSQTYACSALTLTDEGQGDSPHSLVHTINIQKLFFLIIFLIVRNLTPNVVSKMLSQSIVVQIFNQQSKK